MKSKKTLIIILVIAGILIMALVWGAVFKGLNYAGDYQKSIYGDDSKIIATGDSYSYIMKVGSIRNSGLKWKFRFTGMDTVYKLDTEKADTVNIKYNVNITSGKFKIVLISPDEEVTTIIEGPGEGTKELNLESGISRIKLVGKDAVGDIELTIDNKENVIIESIDN